MSKRNGAWLLCAFLSLGACDKASVGLGIDAGPDIGQDACVPHCHWDCFGGVTCWEGDIWLLAYAPHPCCQPNDSWPYPGPVCGDGSPTYPCAEGCSGADPRYAYCVKDSYLGLSYELHDSLLSLYCAEGAPRNVGHPCATDQDCRPAVEAVERLHCDEALAACVAETRPATPLGFGEPCGIAVQDVMIRDEGLGSGPECDLCHYRYEQDAPCVYQACTMECEYDEDCPAGTVCLCYIPYGELRTRFCAPAADLDARFTPQGRTAWLTCQ